MRRRMKGGDDVARDGDGVERAQRGRGRSADDWKQGGPRQDRGQGRESGRNTLSLRCTLSW